MNPDTSAPVHQFPTVRQYMTSNPFTIGREQSLARAREIMLEHRIHHLPVLDQGRVFGLLTERDLLLVESMPGVNPSEVRVEDAMVEEVFTASPDEPVADVVGGMLDRHVGSAVVTEAGQILGVFTTVDALRVLHQRLERP